MVLTIITKTLYFSTCHQDVEIGALCMVSHAIGRLKPSYYLTINCACLKLNLTVLMSLVYSLLSIENK
uniref:Uncharacterized protein n=1 Tax=Sphaerodactylus townsendi TaxID=933632 RepID=A0ACB8FUI2_9SAUR